MKITEIEKLNQLVSRNDMTGNEKVEWLTDFIDKYVTERLRLNDVSNRRELLLAYLKYQNSTDYKPETRIDKEVEKFLSQQ